MQIYAFSSNLQHLFANFVRNPFGEYPQVLIKHNYMLDKDRGLWVAQSDNGPITLTGRMCNRHGLIAGATGTGKTVTLQVMAETFCQAGVPCFMADMKGDLSGIARPGKLTPFIEKRMVEFGMESQEFQGCPVRFYDVYGEQGHPMRATISDLGPELLSRLLELNDTQSGVLNIVFRIADERGLLLLDVKDLRSMLDYTSKNAAEFKTKYGNISPASVGAIQRSLLALEDQGADKFFGEPAFNVMDLLDAEGGKGVMNVLAADKLMLRPKLYSTFLLWLLSDLYEKLPEVGDMELPRLVFFFDEAHMLFDGTSKALVDKIEQIVRLIRSKGVGVYFVTQLPDDIPDNILGQLGNRVQHALRAFTPRDQKAVKAAAETFRTNPAFKTDEAIMSLGTGEALVSFLDGKGAPAVVEKCKILFPLSQIGAITPADRQDIIKRSRVYGRYDTPIDRESAFEILLKQSEEADKAAAEENEKNKKSTGKKSSGLGGKIFGAVLTAVTASLARSAGTAVSNSLSGNKKKSSAKSSGRKSVTGKAATSAASAATRTITREITRGLLGNLISR